MNLSKKDVKLIIEVYKEHLEKLHEMPLGQNFDLSAKQLDSIYIEIAKRDFKSLFF